MTTMTMTMTEAADIAVEMRECGAESVRVSVTEPGQTDHSWDVGYNMDDMCGDISEALDIPISMPL